MVMAMMMGRRWRRGRRRGRGAAAGFGLRRNGAESQSEGRCSQESNTLHKMSPLFKRAAFGAPKAVQR